MKPKVIAAPDVTQEVCNMHIHMMVMMMMENMMIIIADNKHSNNNTFGFTIRAVTKTNDERRGRGEGSSDEIWLSASW